MAVGVLVLWLFTAAAGFSLLLTSNLGHTRSRAEAPAAEPATASLAPAAPAASPAQDPTASGPNAPAASRREMRQARRERFDPPSLVAARKAPVLPEARSVLEFAHPACGIIGLAFWLGFTLVHNRVLGWIAFGLVAVTACAGLAWFTANVRAAKRQDQGQRHDQNPRHDRDKPTPSFNGRLVALHGGGAALTFVLAALSAIVLHG
jgi:hypothetical protein